MAGWPSPTAAETALWAGLGYDFKGNVASRPPLLGGATLTYTWDEFDRLRSAARGYPYPPAYYDYDAGGRLLKRNLGSETTINYWLGLNKIAEERWGDEAGADDPVFRPSAEANGDNIDCEPSGTPSSDGWAFIWGAGTQSHSYDNDADRGLVLHADSTDSGPDSASAFIGEWAGWSDYNPYDVKFNDGSRLHLGVWLRTAIVNKYMTITASVQTTGGLRYIRFYTYNGTDRIHPTQTDLLQFYLGTAYNDTEWHYFEFDLEARLQALMPTETITTVHGFSVHGTEFFVDDLILSEGKLEKSYSLIPGAAIGGYLGVQSGEAGGDAGASTPAWSRWHHHYNDLGTVIAATDEDGAKIGVYTPDFWGNYREPIETETLQALRESLDPAGRFASKCFVP